MKRRCGHLENKNVVEVKYHRTGQSTNINDLGMREMQARVYEHRNSQYLLVKAPPHPESPAP